jgi:hypothetical protein
MDKITLGDGVMAVGKGRDEEGGVYLSFSRISFPMPIGEEVTESEEVAEDFLRIYIKSLDSLAVVEKVVALVRSALEKGETACQNRRS